VRGTPQADENQVAFVRPPDQTGAARRRRCNLVHRRSSLFFRGSTFAERGADIEVARQQGDGLPSRGPAPGRWLIKGPRQARRGPLVYLIRRDAGATAAGEASVFL